MQFQFLDVVIIVRYKVTIMRCSRNCELESCSYEICSHNFEILQLSDVVAIMIDCKVAVMKVSIKR